MTTEATTTLLRSRVRPVLDEFAQDVARSLSGIDHLIQEAHSSAYPYSLFMTLSGGASHTDVVIEVSLRESDRGMVITAEVLREDGDVLGPALIRRLPDGDHDLDGELAIGQFVWQLRPFLRGSLIRIAEALEVETYEVARVAGSSAQFDFDHEYAHRRRHDFLLKVQQIFSKRLATPLQPGWLSLKTGERIRFELVGNDGGIVGTVRWTESRYPITQLTNAVWNLRQVQGANRRLLVVGPSREPLRRWLNRYGAEAAKPVEIWFAHDGSVTQEA